MAPATMKALKVVEKEKAEVQEVPVPKVRADRILVKVSHVALNPTDWKHIDYLPYPGATVGCDYTGIVEEVGAEVGGDWKKGDRIAGVAHGCNPDDLEGGVFGEYAVVAPNGALKVPDSVPDEEAATIGVAFVTTGLSLYQRLHLPWPGSVPANVPVLIYGGSSATGSTAIQWAKLSGVTVLTTCSPRNFDFVKSLGASEVFDYNDPDCAKKIREATGDKLHFVMDCIGGEIGSKVCTEAVSSKGGQIVTIVPQTEYPREDVRSELMLAYTAMGEKINIMGFESPALKEEYALVGMYFRLGEKLLAEGKVKAHPPRVGQGLEGVLAGLDEMRQGKVSGTKLVYKIQ